MKVKIEKLSKEVVELIDRALLLYSLEHPEEKQTVYLLTSRMRKGELILWDNIKTKKDEQSREIYK